MLSFFLPPPLFNLQDLREKCDYSYKCLHIVLSALAAGNAV